VSDAFIPANRFNGFTDQDKSPFKEEGKTVETVQPEIGST